MATSKHERLWKQLGHKTGESSPSSTWRWWKAEDEHRIWVIAAPNDLAAFKQVHRTVYLDDEELFTARTQWEATWKTLAYFYEHIVPRL
jgi:hypothetical protein